MFIVFLVSNIDWQPLVSYLISSSALPIDFMSSFLESPITLIIVGTLFVLAIASIFFWLSYWKVLIANLNIAYLKWEKIAFFKNKYFDFKTIFKYLSILLWSIAYLLIPVLIFIILFLFIYLIFWGYDNVIALLHSSESLKFSIPLFIIFTICIIFFIYIAYRIAFSYIILLDKGNDKSALYYVKKSIKKTKWFKSVFRFLVLSIILSLFILPFDIFSSVVENNMKKIKDYMNYKKGVITYDDYYYEWLKLEFNNYTKEDFEKEYYTNRNFSFILYIFFFLFINWLFDMLMVSFYKRQLKLWTKK